jgi:hypothetical protein
MSSCPSCAATVRAGDPWCTLCWTDLRPKPEPPPPAPVVAPVAAPLTPPVQAAVAAPRATVDPLTAPLAAVLSEPLAADPDAPDPTWPCVSCNGMNHIDLNACATCGAPFGGWITRDANPKATKRRVLLLASAGVGVFLLLLAAITLMGTRVDKKPADGSPTGTTVEQSSGRSSNTGPAVGDGVVIG